MLKFLFGVLCFAVSAVNAQGLDVTFSKPKTILTGPQFDPSKTFTAELFGSSRFSTRKIGIEIIRNSLSWKHHHHPIYSNRRVSEHRVTTRWRLRITYDSALLRYEIRF